MSKIKYDLSPKGPNFAASFSTDTGLSGMLFFVRTKFFQDYWKLNFSCQRLGNALSLEFNFILTKYITWLPKKKACDMSPCTRTPPGLVLLLQLWRRRCPRSSATACGHLGVPGEQPPVLTAFTSVCSRREVRKAVSDAWHGNLSTSSSSPADLKTFLELRPSDYFHVQN